MSRVNALCPGYCHSEMVDPYVEAEPALFEKIIHRHNAMNRSGESQEAEDATECLLSSQSSLVNGAETTRLY